MLSLIIWINEKRARTTASIERVFYTRRNKTKAKNAEGGYGKGKKKAVKEWTDSYKSEETMQANGEGNVHPRSTVYRFYW